MTSTGPTSDQGGSIRPGTQNQKPIPPETAQRTQSATNTPVLQQFTPVDWRKALKRPTTVTVLSAQPVPSLPATDASQAFQNRNAVYVLEVSDGKLKFLVRSLTPYPEGSTLTLQATDNDPNTILIKSASNMSTNSMLLSQLHKQLAALTDKPVPLPQLISSINQTLRVLAKAVESVPQKNTDPQANSALEKSLQRFTKQASALSATLNKTIIEPGALKPSQIKEQIAKSGLYLESNLAKNAQLVQGATSQDRLTKDQAQKRIDHLFTVFGHDQKRGLSMLLQTATQLYQQLFRYLQLSQHIKAPNTYESILSNLATKPLGEMTGTDGGNPTAAQPIQKRFEAMLQKLLLNNQLNMPQQSTQTTQQALTNMYGLAALLHFFSQLSHAPTSSTLMPLLDTGWGNLFTLLFGSPSLLAKNANTSTAQEPIKALQALINQIQGQLIRLTAKQLVLLSQKEQQSEKQTVTQLELFLTYGEQILQVPLAISRLTTRKNSKRKQNKPGWQVELGVDLGSMGLIRTIALYTPGCLALTFQVQHIETRKLIAKESQKLHTPLAKWGITLESVNFQPYQAKQENNNPPGEDELGFQFVDIQL